MTERGVTERGGAEGTGSEDAVVTGPGGKTFANIGSVAVSSELSGRDSTSAVCA